MIICTFHLFLSSASSFSSQYLLFLKSSRSCVVLPLHIPFPSVNCPSIASWRRQFLLKTLPTQLSFLHRILFICPLLFYTFKKLFISYLSGHFIFSNMGLNWFFYLSVNHLITYKYLYSKTDFPSTIWISLAVSMIPFFALCTIISSLHSQHNNNNNNNYYYYYYYYYYFD